MSGPSQIARPASVALMMVLIAAAPTAVNAADSTPTYLDGLLAGQAQGREEGRALEIGATLPADEQAAIQAAFKAGYSAGANDAFTGYDGGWVMALPYVVMLVPGAGPITYRIASRTPFEPGIAYFLCPDGRTLCEAPQK